MAVVEELYCSFEQEAVISAAQLARRGLVAQIWPEED